jgi:hypothetical protein
LKTVTRLRLQGRWQPCTEQLEISRRELPTPARLRSRKKQNEKAEAGLLTGGEGERSDKTLIGKLRNGKKRDMGRRLACN